MESTWRRLSGRTDEWWARREPVFWFEDIDGYAQITSSPPLAFRDAATKVALLFSFVLSSADSSFFFDDSYLADRPKESVRTWQSWQLIPFCFCFSSSLSSSSSSSSSSFSPSASLLAFNYWVIPFGRERRGGGGSWWRWQLSRVSR